MYLNIDAGTMNPLEHGEVFVTNDRVETDQDMGHYERFLGEDIPGKNYITAGQIYWEVLKRERSFGYAGKTVDTFHEIPEEIIRRINAACSGHEIVVVELGGSVGEYQNIMFFEAVRRLKVKKPESSVLVHVGYLPFVKTLGELKSKPIQQSIHELNSLGLQPDFVVARAERAIDKKRREKIAFSASMEVEDVISNPDVANVYEVPLVLDSQSLTAKILKRLGLRGRRADLKEWSRMIARVESSSNVLKVGIVAKYINSD